MKPIIFAALATISVAVQAQDAYKCKTAAGYVYQDSPCRVAAPAKPPVATEVSAPTVKAEPVPPGGETESHVDRQKRLVDAMAKDRKRSDLRYQIAGAERDIDALVASMNNELAVLRAQKSTANNNLAGATWEQSISTEMQAVTNRYQIQIDAARAQLVVLRAELAEIK